MTGTTDQAPKSRRHGLHELAGRGQRQPPRSAEPALSEPITGDLGVASARTVRRRAGRRDKTLAASLRARSRPRLASHVTLGERERRLHRRPTPFAPI